LMILYCCLCCSLHFSSVFSYTDPATTEIYTLSLHDALPISIEWFPTIEWATLLPTLALILGGAYLGNRLRIPSGAMLVPLVLGRSEEHTSELQSRENLVCRLLLEKKKKK